MISGSFNIKKKKRKKNFLNFQFFNNPLFYPISVFRSFYFLLFFKLFSFLSFSAIPAKRRSGNDSLKRPLCTCPLMLLSLFGPKFIGAVFLYSRGLCSLHRVLNWCCCCFCSCCCKQCSYAALLLQRKNQVS